MISFTTLDLKKNSSLFNKIFQASKVGGNVELIKCKEGSSFIEFNNNDARNNYIKTFFGKIYQAQNLPDGSIEDFLGEEIINNPAVQGKKLSENKKLLLDRPPNLSRTRRLSKFFQL